MVGASVRVGVTSNDATAWLPEPSVATTAVIPPGALPGTAVPCEQSPEPSVGQLAQLLDEPNASETVALGAKPVTEKVKPAPSGPDIVVRLRVGDGSTVKVAVAVSPEEVPLAVRVTGPGGVVGGMVTLDPQLPEPAGGVQLPMPGDPGV